ncbi:MAG: nucleotidyltransferase domain-containing protein [Nanoarchaeota archaeon]|nr:nucleotidyltransferase domain-containing protein [Nanoarchaeota archaeon]MBU4300488.1 nucleotidyltransferase domain-containing protein [Nanoarchaeota archaeon]MBU4451968.1 nucleotidyltransferase domain-containing protein [Nanoarchaeota archaeon]MCG2724128.1 nucleotidyltransferase domain-containing protein [archaeon]
MLVDIVFGSKAVWRALVVLAQAPGQGVTKEEIKEITKLGGNAIFRSMEILLHNSIVDYEKSGNKTYYRMNMANKYARMAAEIIQSERKDLNNMSPKIAMILREYVRQATDSVEISAIYVFGSIVKSSYRADSDVDMAIITEKELSAKERILLEKIGERAEIRFGREIQPHFFTEIEFEKTTGGVVEQVKRDGIRLV